MRELTVVEICDVSGAGWLQTALTDIGGRYGVALWTADNASLNIALPLIGDVSLTTLAPDLGRTIGSTIGSTIGGAIENTLSSLPAIGSFFKTIFA